LVFDNEGYSAYDVTQVPSVGRHTISTVEDLGSNQWLIGVGDIAWEATDVANARGIQGHEVSLNAADTSASLYTVLSNTDSGVLVETSDDLSGIVGQELIGVHTLNTLNVLGGAKVDFGDDRVVLLDAANSEVDVDSELTAPDMIPASF